MAVVSCGITRYAYASYAPRDSEDWCLESSDYRIVGRASALVLRWVPPQATRS